MHQNLALHYPKARPGFFNIGLLHTALEGREGHQAYAPCSARQLEALGYDYWALGHVHQREVVSTEPHIVFPGNLQGRNIRETGPKGATLFEVSALGVSAMRALVLDQVRWAKIEVPLEGAHHWEEALELCARAVDDELGRAEGRTLACRLQLTGQSPAHIEVLASDRLLNELRAVALDRGSVYIEDVEVRTRGELTFAGLIGRGDAFAEALSACFADAASEVRKEELKQLLLRELSALPQELVRSELDEIDSIWDESTRLLEARLLEPRSRAGEAP
jgi:DNA repair protein SbcD/Mre11